MGYGWYGVQIVALRRLRVVIAVRPRKRMIGMDVTHPCVADTEGAGAPRAPDVADMIDEQRHILGTVRQFAGNDLDAVFDAVPVGLRGRQLDDGRNFPGFSEHADGGIGRRGTQRDRSAPSRDP